jgi:hypothetical protein
MEGKNKIGRLRKSWIDEIDEDLKAIGIRILYSGQRPSGMEEDFIGS